MKKFFLFLLFYFFNIANTLAFEFTLIPTDTENAELAQSFRDGGFEISDIPIYLEFLTSKFIVLAISLSVLALVYTGVEGIIKGFDEGGLDKERIKNILFKALPVIVFAWLIIDLVFRFILE
jgi:hypothetical protein